MGTPRCRLADDNETDWIGGQWWAFRMMYLSNSITTEALSIVTYTQQKKGHIGDSIFNLDQ
jgi:hypothetical protein